MKALFGDQGFREKWKLTAVNSINWARVMAQVVYYFTTAAALGAPARVPAFSVPTGNFGDAFAGHVARRMGLGIGQLVIATNANDILVRLLAGGEYRKGPVHATISPSIDIQVSSNFERLLFELLDGDGDAVARLMADLDREGVFQLGAEPMDRMRRQFEGRAVTEDEMLGCMAAFHDQTGVVIDPHTAVGIVAGRERRRRGAGAIVHLSTAHAAKFPNAVERATGAQVALPPRLADLHQREEHYDVLPNDLGAVKAYVAERARL